MASCVKNESDLSCTHTGDIVAMQNPGTEKMGLGVCLEYHQTEKGTGPDSVCPSQYNDSQCTNGVEITVDQIKSESSGAIVVSNEFVEEKSEARLEWDCKEGSNRAHQEEQPIPSPQRNGIELSNGRLLTTRTDSNPYSGEKTHSCNECGKVFPNVAAFTKHMKMHSAEKKYICGQCGKGFTRSEYLKKHQSVHTGEKPHVCSECGQRFTVAGSLKVHMRFHSGEKPYQCTECGMRFFTRATYKNHILNHSGERPNVCGQCGKSFKNAVSLRRHCHSEKPYSCSECGKSFTTLFHLTVHKRVHSGEKPYSCTECGKSFTNGTNLNMHMRIHSGEKPYSCTLCEKSFAQRSGLTVHMRTHSEEKPSMCDHCGKHFKCTYYLKKHLKVHSSKKSQGKLTRTVKTESDSVCANPAYTAIIQSTNVDEVYLNAGQIKSEHIHPDYVQVAEDPNTQCIDSEKFTEAKLESRGRLAVFKHTENSDAMQDLSIVKVGLEGCLDSEQIKTEYIDSGSDQLRHNVQSQFADCDRTGVKCEFSEGITDLIDFATNSTTEVCNEDEKQRFERDVLTPDTKQLSFSRNDHNNQKSYCVDLFQIEQHQQDNSNMNKYGCLDCGKHFKSPSSLKVHKRVHSGEKPYSCTECGKSFAQAVHLNIHMRIHSGEKPYSCTLCEKSFAQGSGLTVHMRTHSEEKPSKCDQCGKHFKCMSYLKRHLKVHFRKKSQGRLLMTGKTKSDSDCANTAYTIVIQNADIDEVYPNARQIKSEHIDPDYVQMAEDSNTQCIDSEIFTEAKLESRGCRAIFKHTENSGAMQDFHTINVGLEECWESEQIKPETVDPGYDQVRHNVESQLNSDTKQVSFSRDDHSNQKSDCVDSLQIEQHQRDNLNMNKHGCLDCGKSFKSPSSLKIHKKTHSREKIHSCNECGKTFANRTHLARHKETHLTEKTYICDQCGKGFTTRFYLKKHQRVHSGEKPHICSECGQRFTVAYSLKVHMRFHSGEKPYQCAECDMRFYTRATFKKHLLKHSGERSNICGKCGKSFKDAASLRQHCHSERPYICTECGKSFTRAIHLTVHKRIHSGEKPFTCTVCGKSFSDISNLKKHVKKCFTDVSYLRRHLKVNLGERSHGCTVCGKKFSSTSNLRKHERIHSIDKGAIVKTDFRPELLKKRK
ncbi:uncharacterized protein [Paramormyrops kingsleyae]|uniref:uncharacterized protein n=1 Tax=Paramormyrops kingsleyae TaxID=1676925 RepID=UPI003B974985